MIDKFAALPWVGKAASLFGNVRHVQLPSGAALAGFWGPAEKATGLKIPQGRFLPPELVIQDELHLISGPLGTLAGLCEAVIERLMRPTPDSPPPKIVASTATVRRAEAQTLRSVAAALSQLCYTPTSWQGSALTAAASLNRCWCRWCVKAASRG